MKEEEAIKRRFERVARELNERTRRLVAASEAMAMGWGGISAVSRATGLSRKAISHGIKELEEGLAPELCEELNRLSLPFTDDTIPSDAELRIAQAQLVGWLEGLFHGIQTALFAQQMAARAQLEQMRRALPPGMSDQPQQSPTAAGPYL